MKSTIEKLAPLFISEKKEKELFTKNGEPRQSKKAVNFICKNAKEMGRRQISPTSGSSVLRVDFQSGKNAGCVKYFKVTSQNHLGQHTEKVEYFAE
jgi:hypothetical protein